MATHLDTSRLQSYGAGNAPGRADILDALRAASDRGVLIVNLTQCHSGCGGVETHSVLDRFYRASRNAPPRDPPRAVRRVLLGARAWPIRP